MTVNFCIKGRLGNAIFRYMACVIMCIVTNNNYSDSQKGSYNIDDKEFNNIIIKLLNNSNFRLKLDNCNMTDFYHHDEIYNHYKKQIITFIKNNPSHIITTDGISAGDRMYEKYKIIDILNTNSLFDKKYKNVLHLRLEDFVTHNLFLPVERILNLLNKNIITENICIVCKLPTTEFEINYIQTIKTFIHDHLNNIKIIIEHNDVLTDYYIMKEAEILICSKSTLSWCAAFFSTTIKKCYIPENKEKNNMTFKKPIENTIMY